MLTVILIGFGGIRGITDLGLGRRFAQAVGDLNVLKDKWWRDLEMGIHKAEHLVIHRAFGMFWDSKDTHGATASMLLKVIILDLQVGDLTPENGNLLVFGLDLFPERVHQLVALMQSVLDGSQHRLENLLVMLHNGGIQKGLLKGQLKSCGILVI